jgi:predicted Fe-Mo cluster-binding NifX family protein
MMTIAIPFWNGRVSPVFDVAGKLLLVENNGQGGGTRWEAVLTAADPYARAAELAATGADVLICGAISRPMELAVHAAGIEVVPQTCGDVEGVLNAFLEGRLNQPDFLMPGCCGRRRRLRGRAGRGEQRGFGRGNRLAGPGPGLQ